MTLCLASLAALATAASAQTTLPVEPDARPEAPAPRIIYAEVLDEDALAISPASPAPPSGQVATTRALQPLGESTALADEGLRLGKVDLFKGGKLLLTNGVTTVEGSSGGGLARWATIGGRQMPGGIGLSAHATAVELPDYGWRSYGVAVGFGDRVELSYSRADFDTRDVGALLGIGQGYTFNMDTFGAKLRVAGDLVYGESWLPQIAVGIEHKRSRDGALVRALGAADDEGTDYTLSATKLLLARSVLVNATLRYTEANELGLLGFGSAAGADYKLQFEGSLGYQLSRRAVVGAEYRSKPDNLGLGDDDWMDIFAAYALTDNLTLTAAYVDLGSIATFSDQRGGFLSAQVAF
ncbi:DUF3034 family protein [Porphyrobacter sp. YT40]|uniref:DUF3034 family protein n=1 Tax=Porphyrobacter sp. YT40 TaxID=2547601 RepID=UPI001143D411|nr:DUF3034 family protein [Porphyrobacter sp. YT40]QDH35735.1 DUF3034 family protein [Porphyrobacter sp. YT40]